MGAKKQESDRRIQLGLSNVLASLAMLHHGSWMRFRQGARAAFVELVNSLSSSQLCRQGFPGLTPSQRKDILHYGLYLDFIQDYFVSITAKSPPRRRELVSRALNRHMGWFKATQRASDRNWPDHDARVVDLSTWHRHPHHQEAFRRSITGVQLLKDHWIVSPARFALGASAMVRYPKTAVQLAELLAYAEHAAQREHWPSYVIGSAHGLYAGQARHYAAFAKIHGAVTVVLQPGLFHALASFNDQTEYEGELADVFLGWGRNLQEMKAQQIEFGSPYADRELSSERQKGTQFVLPQIPAGPERPISTYWGLSRAEFFQNSGKLLRLINENNIAGPVSMRMKHVDENEYKRILGHHSQGKLISTVNVNTATGITQFETNKVLYLSTALVELRSAERLSFQPFPVMGSFHPSEERRLKEIIERDGRRGDTNLLKEYLDDSVKPISPEESATTLHKLLR